MRYNPPPNWPPPPAGWQPPPGWAPDPAWPPAPKDWQVFVDDEAAPEPAVVPSRPQRLDDEGEYFGTDRAWSDTGAEAEIAVVSSEVEPPASPVEIMAGRLTAEHLGCTAMIRWDDDRRYEIGTIEGVSADASGISVRLTGGPSISLPREESSRGPTNPRLYLWP